MRVCWLLVLGAIAVCTSIAPVQAQSHGAAMSHGSKAGPIAAPKSGSSIHPGHATVSKPAATAPKGSRPVAPTHAAVTVNPIASKIASHPQLNAKITALLPPHTTLNQASAGFKNQGQFIAALHVSHNLGIPFKALKADMTVRHMSLGRSIQDLRHTSRTAATTQASRAEHEADLDQTTAAPTSSSSVVRTTRDRR